MVPGLGADDYMTKPVDIRELVLHVTNIVSRRGDGPAPTGTPIVVDGNRIKNPSRSVTPNPEKKRSSSMFAALVLIGVSIGEAGAFWLTMEDTLSTATVSDSDTQTASSPSS